tara:strand:- start:8 stop:154 length:147 start_codon:yes stop_codon:yes gene_type:complete
MVVYFFLDETALPSIMHFAFILKTPFPIKDGFAPQSGLREIFRVSVNR